MVNKEIDDAKTHNIYTAAQSAHNALNHPIMSLNPSISPTNHFIPSSF